MGVVNPGGQASPNFPGQTLTAAKLALSSAAGDAISVGNGGGITNGGGGSISLDNNGPHFSGNFVFCTSAAGQEAAAASAGAGAAPPATVQGYFICRDSGGNTRKVPFYAN